MLRALLISLILVLPSAIRSEEVNIAVASNFAAPMQLLESAFEAASSHRLQISFGSSGSLYAQMLNGAPFGVFLSADQVTVDALDREDLILAETRFTYAVGGLVLWSANADLIDEDIQVLSDGRYQHLAIANPELAPYGQAALDVLTELGLYDQAQSKLVTGENISQTHQFVASGNAELGFIALSQVMRDGAISSGSGGTWNGPWGTQTTRPLV